MPKICILQHNILKVVTEFIDIFEMEKFNNLQEISQLSLIMRDFSGRKDYLNFI